MQVVSRSGTKRKAIFDEHSYETRRLWEMMLTQKIEFRQGVSQKSEEGLNQFYQGSKSW